MAPELGHAAQCFFFLVKPIIYIIFINFDDLLVYFNICFLTDREDTVNVCSSAGFSNQKTLSLKIVLKIRVYFWTQRKILHNRNV